jgi:hypothetical protein
MTIHPVYEDGWPFQACFSLSGDVVVLQIAQQTKSGLCQTTQFSSRGKIRKVSAEFGGLAHPFPRHRLHHPKTMAAPPFAVFKGWATRVLALGRFAAHAASSPPDAVRSLVPQKAEALQESKHADCGNSCQYP